MKNISSKNLALLIVILMVIIGVFAYYEIYLKSSPAIAPTTTSTTPPKEAPKEDDMVNVTTPQPNAEVTSPLIVEGKAKGTWFFEASFPVKLVDDQNQVIASGIAQAQGEWMTNNFVPFKAELTFSVKQKTSGTLVIEKDNPSGLPEHDDHRKIPVTIMPTSVQP